MKKNDLPEAAAKVWEKVKKNRYVLIVLLLGLILILWPKSGDKNENSQSEPSDTPAFSVEAEEKRISNALSELDGAGTVRVVLTLRTGAERIVAEDSEISVDQNGGKSESRVTTVIVSSGSSKEEPVTLKYVYPEYMGALVVAEGAGSAEIRLQLTQAVANLTGLPTAKITVVKMYGKE